MSALFIVVQQRNKMLAHQLDPTVQRRQPVSVFFLRTVINQVASLPVLRRHQLLHKKEGSRLARSTSESCLLSHTHACLDGKEDPREKQKCRQLRSRNANLCAHNSYATNGSQNAALALAERIERSVTEHPLGFIAFAAKRTARLQRPSKPSHASRAMCVGTLTARWRH